MTYTTKQGDMWDAIAYSQMGSTAYTDKLMTANQEHINYFTFPAGVVLTIPAVSTEDTATRPPWKKVSG